MPSANRGMTRRYGIDTSILVRLLTGDPPEIFERCVAGLGELAEEGCEVFASNQVIGEAYVAVQHHYGVSKVEARSGLADVLRSGLVGPRRGRRVLAALGEGSGAGLLDRLIAMEYEDEGLTTLTLDERMARLPETTLLA